MEAYLIIYVVGVILSLWLLRNGYESFWTHVLWSVLWPAFYAAALAGFVLFALLLINHETAGGVSWWKATRIVFSKPK